MAVALSSAAAADREQIRQVIRSHNPEIRRCYETELAKVPNLEGTLLLKITIDSHGKVVAATSEPATLGNTTVEQCSVAAAKTWVFVPNQDGNTVVTYPFRLQSTGERLEPAAQPATARKAQSIPAALLKKDKISSDDDPHLPDAVKFLHPCDTMRGAYKVCVEPTGGTVSSVEVIERIPEADTQIVATLKAWRFKAAQLGYRWMH